MLHPGFPRTLSQGGGWGLYGLLSAPVTTWDAITEAEIGKDWVQFLIDEADSSGSLKEGVNSGGFATAASVPMIAGNSAQYLPTLTPSH